MSALAIIDRMARAAKDIGAIIEVHPLATPEDEVKAGSLLRIIKTLVGEAEAERKRLKAPHLKAGKEVDEIFREPRKELERVERLVKRRLAEAAQFREAVRTLAITDAREAALAGDPEAANAAILSIDVAPTTSGISERWTYEVESADLRKVPLEFLELDMGKVRAGIQRANKEGSPPKIAGVVFRKVASIVARRL